MQHHYLERLLSTLLLLSQFIGSSGEFPGEYIDRSKCETIVSWNDLRRTIEYSPGSLVLCPFSLTKKEYEPTIRLTRGIHIVCQEIGKCRIEGPNTHIEIESQAPVTIEGIEFSEATSSSLVVSDLNLNISRKSHVICNCAFDR